MTAVFDREKQLAIPDDVRSSMLSVFSLSVQVVFVAVSVVMSVLLTHSVRVAYGIVGTGLLLLVALLATTSRRWAATRSADS
jgi:hypothetical protein